MNQEPFDTYPVSMPFFDVGYILRTAWARFKPHGIVLVLAPIVSGVIGSIPGALDRSIDLFVGPDTSIFSSIRGLCMALLSMALAAFLEAGLLRMALSAVRGASVRLDELFSGRRFVLPLMLLQLLLVSVVGVLCVPVVLASIVLQSFVAMAVGALVGVVLWLVLLCGFVFTPFFIVDRRLGPIAAMRASWKATDGVKTELFRLEIVITLLLVIGTFLTWGFAFAASTILSPLLGVVFLLAWGLALAVAAPFAGVAVAVAYAVRCGNEST